MGIYLFPDSEYREEVSDPAKNSKGMGRNTYIRAGRRQCKKDFFRPNFIIKKIGAAMLK